MQEHEPELHEPVVRILTTERIIILDELYTHNGSTTVAALNDAIDSLTEDEIRHHVGVLRVAGILTSNGNDTRIEFSAGGEEILRITKSVEHSFNVLPYDTEQP